MEKIYLKNIYKYKEIYFTVFNTFGCLQSVKRFHTVCALHSLCSVVITVPTVNYLHHLHFKIMTWGPINNELHLIGKPSPSDFVTSFIFFFKMTQWLLSESCTTPHISLLIDVLSLYFRLFNSFLQLCWCYESVLHCFFFGGGGWEY